jgi:hypothetical protein
MIVVFLLHFSYAARERARARRREAAAAINTVRKVGAPGAPVHDVGDRRKKEVRPPTERQYPAGTWGAPRK